VRLDNGKLLPAITPALLLQPSAAVVASSILSWPGISALLSWVAAGHFLAGLGPQELGRALMDVQARAVLCCVADRGVAWSACTTLHSR
jgi:hypothetical protein